LPLFLLLLLLWRLQHHLYGRIKNPLHILKLQNRSHEWQWHNTVPMENKKKKRGCVYLLCFRTTFNVERSSNKFFQFLPLQQRQSQGKKLIKRNLYKESFGAWCVGGRGDTRGWSYLPEQ
jgi:hypothetical protein